MFSRIRNAFGSAFLLTLMTSIAVLAKGGFSFIAITGPNLRGPLRSTDPGLTTDFFAFADFYRDRTEAPTNPGTGYEITRYYVDGRREIPFDQLHYYPDTGFVYYDGVAGGGSSEYDGEWYTARPEIKTLFESILSKASQPSAAVSQPESANSIAQAEDNRAIPRPQALQWIAAITGFVALLWLALRLRKAATQ